MGLHSAGSIIIKTSQTYLPTPEGGAAFVSDLHAKLKLALWAEVIKIKAHLTFNAVAIVAHNQILLGGELYEFYDTTPPTGPHPVLIGSTIQDTLNTLGALVEVYNHWTYTVQFSSPFWQITFNDIPDNLEFCSVFPTGTVGLYDYSPAVGQGNSWGGGWRVKSANLTGGVSLSLDIVTNNRDGCIQIFPTDEVTKFDLTPGTWTIIANKYQFFLLVPLSTGPGTFLYAGHLFPARGLTFCNYLTGPINPVSPSGGSRAGFTIGGNYYINSGGAFFSSNVSDVNKNPAMCFPGFGSGITALDKLNNSIAGIPIKNDVGNGFPFDAHIAGPRLAGEDVRILGWMWDALIYSVYFLQDDPGKIGTKNAYVVMSQPGGLQNSMGSLLVQSEN